MKRTTLSLLSTGLMASLVGCATTDLQPHSGVQAETEQTRSEEYRLVTGSRIRQRVDPDAQDDLYTSYPVTVFSREDLERTGRGHVGDALRRLYPPLF